MAPLLSPNEWRQLEPLLDALLDAPPDRRAERLAELTGGDEARREMLERLVAECEAELAVIGRPAVERFSALARHDPVHMPEALTDRYRITGEVGRGGMAAVYLARDVKHARNVAVKVLLPQIAAALGREQFLREIEIVAQLRHPNIVPLYDSGESDGVLYYVMPYEEGHSLRERLDRDGPLPVDDVVVILRDICEALACAHEHGVVHRDIKPDNVLLAGRHAMVADFGLASVMTAASGHPTLARLALLLGTPAYMAPEQAPGSEAGFDHRADIYAVGVLAYELLVGAPPFNGDTPRQILAAHARSAPPPLAGRRLGVPNVLGDAVMRCLAKDPAERWQSADELLARLEPLALGRGDARATTSSHGAAHRTRVAVAIGLVAAASLAAGGLFFARGGAASPGLALGRARQITSERGLEVQPTLSPDGNRIAYAGGQTLAMHIYVRPLDGGRALRLTSDTAENQWLPRWAPDGSRILFLSRGGVESVPPGGGVPRTEVAGRPGAIVTSATWSPDGREIAYVRGDSLIARDVATGRSRLITTGADLHSCSWSPNDMLACVAGNWFYVTVGKISGLGPMFANHAPSRIVLVPAAGGVPMPVTDSGSLHQSPIWSPDGRTLYYVSNRDGTRDLYGLAIGKRAPARESPARLTTGLGAHSVTMSADGRRVVYAVYGSNANVWSIDIPAKPPVSAVSAVPVTSGNQTVEGVRIAGDRRWLVYDSDLSGNSDIYRLSLSGGEPERLTTASVDEYRGAISPDGRELAYHTFQTGTRNVFLMPIGGGSVRQLTPGVKQRSMANWSPDGQALSMFDMTLNTVLVMRRDAGGRWGAPRVVATDGWRPEWSPDGRSLAFVSPTTGRIGIAPADSGTQRDVYVPGPGDPLAELAIYADNGRELYFKSHDEKLRASFWSIPVTGGRPRLLVTFDDPGRSSNRFDFATDGARFYFTIEDRQSDIWMADVARR